MVQNESNDKEKGVWLNLSEIIPSAITYNTQHTVYRGKRFYIYIYIVMGRGLHS